MVGILMVSHGLMSEGIADSLKLIMGEVDQLDYLGLYEGNDFDVFKQKIYDKVIELDHGDGVVILVDLFGASPYNSSAGNMSTWMKEGHNVRLITGMNLPMAMEAVSRRFVGASLDELYPLIMQTAKEEVKELMQELGM